MKKKVPLSNDQREQMISRLVKLGQETLIDLEHLGDCVSENLPDHMAWLKRAKIDPSECSNAIGAIAYRRLREERKAHDLACNEDPKNRLKIVHVGDPDFYSYVGSIEQAEALRADKSPQARETFEAIQARLQAPSAAPVVLNEPEPVTPIPKLADGSLARSREKQEVEQKPAAQKPAKVKEAAVKAVAKRPGLFGYPFSAIARWVAAQFKPKGKAKVDDTLKAKATAAIKKVVKHYKAAISDQTISCQVNAGLRGKDHYGPLPKIEGANQKELKRIAGL